MTTRRWICLIALAIPFFLQAQDRTWEIPTGLSRSVFMDQGSGKMLIATQRDFGIDSTYLHLLSNDVDQQSTTLGSVMLPLQSASLNAAARTTDGAILIGREFGFSTRPFALSMDTLGNVNWSVIFTDLEDAQNQVTHITVIEQRVDMFSWSSPAADSFYRLTGTTDGDFSTALHVLAPDTVDFRVDEVASSVNIGEHVVISSATLPAGERMLYVIGLDSTSVQWALGHDHGSGAMPQLEEASSLISCEDGGYMYTLLYGVSSGTPSVGRLVRMTEDGQVIWAREYHVGADQLILGEPHEKNDGGYLLACSDPNTSEEYVLVLDELGSIQTAQRLIDIDASGAPFARFFENDQGQLYGYGHSLIAETDENATSCVMEPFIGITSTEVTVVESSVTLDFVLEEQATIDIPTLDRAGTYVFEERCISVGIGESEELVDLEIYPDPASERLYFKDRIDGRSSVHIYDMRGNQILANEADLESGLDISTLRQGTYCLILHEAERMYRGTFRVVR